MTEPTTDDIESVVEIVTENSVTLIVLALLVGAAIGLAIMYYGRSNPPQETAYEND